MFTYVTLNLFFRLFLVKRYMGPRSDFQQNIAEYSSFNYKFGEYHKISIHSHHL